VHDRQRARQVGREEQRSLQRRDEQRVERRVVGRDLRAELGDARRQLLRGQVGLAGVEPVV
jgi:hypothetical protein